MKTGMRRFLTLGILATAVALVVLACGPTGPKGQQVYMRVGCNACHGEKGEGGKLLDAPKLAGTQLSLDEFKVQVRTPRQNMMPFTQAQINDADLQEVYNWVKGLP